MLVDGRYYLRILISTQDAAARQIRDGDLVRAFNDRGEVAFAAQVTPRLPAGVVRAYESSAVYDPVGTPGHSVDRGGCVNLLTSHRSQIRGGSSMASNSCLVQIERWQDHAGAAA